MAGPGIVVSDHFKPAVLADEQLVLQLERQAAETHIARQDVVDAVGDASIEYGEDCFALERLAAVTPAVRYDGRLQRDRRAPRVGNSAHRDSLFSLVRSGSSRFYRPSTGRGFKRNLAGR